MEAAKAQLLQIQPGEHPGSPAQRPQHSAVDL